MSTTIDSLQLEVQSQATSAVSGIDALSASLGRLKTAVKGGVGLTSVTNQLKNLNAALDGVDDSAAGKLDSLASSLEKLKGLGNLKISSSIASQLNAIGTAARSLDGVNFHALSNLASALAPLSNVGPLNLNSAISQLNRLPGAISNLNSVDMGFAAQKIRELVSALTPLTTIGNANLGSFFTQIGRLPQMVSTLNSINMQALTNQIRQLANALAPLAAQMNQIAAGFAAFPHRIQQLIQSNTRLSNSNNRLGNSYVNLWAKCRMAMNVVRSGARMIASWITESNSYIENLNLFTASMGKYANEAQKYAEQVGELMGIDPGEWMRNQGVFMTITEGFGVASDRAYIMSKNLTQLGYDLSSFFNISYADAMQKLQSGISGELEPLRRLGYDLSQARLQQEALNLGIKKSITSMTQAEKSQLRYYAIMTQVTKAQGDMARTLNAPANQLRILKAQVVQCARAFGNIFIPVLNAVLPYAIAVAKVLRMIANIIASLFGFALPEIDYSGIEAGAGAVGDVADGLGEAAGNAKKLKNALLGIDELNIISENDKDGGGLGDVGAGGDLGFELPEYDFLNGLIDSKVQELVDKFKEWAGLTGEINSWADFFHTKLGRILTLVGEIAAGLALWKLAKGFMDALSWINKLQSQGLGAPLQLTLGIVLTLSGLTIEWTGLKSIIEDGIDKLNLAESIGGAILASLGSLFIGKSLATLFGVPLLEGLVSGIGMVIAGLPMYIVGIWDAIEEGLNLLNGILITSGATLTGAGIGAMIGALGGPIGAGIGALIGLAVGLLTDLIIALVQHWDEVTEWFENAIESVGKFFGDIFTAVKKFFTETIPGAWADFSAWFSSLDWYQMGYNVGQAVGTAFKNVGDWFTETWKNIKTVWDTFWTQTLPDFFAIKVPEFFEKAKEKITQAAQAVGEWFTETWATITEGWETFWDETLPNFFENLKEIGAQIINGLWEGIKEAWNGFWERVGEWIDGFVQGFKDALGIASPSTVFKEIGGYIVEGLLQGILEPFKNIGKWINKNVITPLKNAFDKSPVGEFVVNLKNNASEWWQNVKDWWEGVSKNGVSLEALVKLVRDKWTTVKNWIGNIPVLSQLIALAKDKWETVKDWIGNIPSLPQLISLAKDKWDTVAKWVGEIPILKQGIQLVKDRWESVRDWIGNIPSLAQYIHLLKNKWTTVKEWVGEIPSLPQLISLAKDKWYTVRDWIGSLPVIQQGIALAKSAWSTVAGWIGNLPVISQGIALAKSAWSTVSGWIGNLPIINQAIGLARSAWTTVASWVTSFGSAAISATVSLVRGWSGTLSSWIGSAVSVTVNLVKGISTNLQTWFNNTVGNSVSVTVNLLKGWAGTIKQWLGFENGGVMTDKGVQFVANGGVFGNGIPMYGNGTTHAGTHGSLFVAGENGAEMVGHINGRTEVMNRFQLATVMQNAVVSGMAQFTGYWRNLNSQMAVCANGVIRAVLVSTDVLSGNLAGAVAYDPTNALAQMVYEDSRSAYDNACSGEDMSKALIGFYRDYLEPSMTRMVTGIEKQADKEEQTIVQIGNRVITDAVDTQRKANGYVFAK